MQAEAKERQGKLDEASEAYSKALEMWYVASMVASMGSCIQRMSTALGTAVNNTETQTPELPSCG